MMLVLPLLLAGCIIERPVGVTIRSDLSDPVEIVYLKDGEMPGGRLEPGATRTFSFDLVRWGVPADASCTTGDIIARSLDGHLVARIPPPVCVERAIRLSDWVVP